MATIIWKQNYGKEEERKMKPNKLRTIYKDTDGNTVFAFGEIGRTGFQDLKVTIERFDIEYMSRDNKEESITVLEELVLKIKAEIEKNKMEV